MKLFKTSDTPLAAVLICLGYDCIQVGVNGQNGRVWFGFDIRLDEALDIEELWHEGGEYDGKDPENLAPFSFQELRELFFVRACLVRIAKGGSNDPDFAPQRFKNHYKAKPAIES